MGQGVRGTHHLPRCPPAGAMVLCLSPTWASRVPSETSPGAWSLLLSRGISFKVGGHSALETFVPPRRANYVTGTLAPGDPEGGWVGSLDSACVRHCH